MKKSHITTNKRMSGKKLPMALGCCSGAASWAKAAMEVYTPDKKIFLAHLSRTNNFPDLAKETVSALAGISRYKLDCLDNLEDSRILKC